MLNISCLNNIAAVLRACIFASIILICFADSIKKLVKIFLAVYAADGTLRASYSGTADSTVGIPQLPAGVYIARVATAGATATLRFLRR